MNSSSHDTPSDSESVTTPPNSRRGMQRAGGAPVPQVTDSVVVPMAALIPPIGSPAHSTLTRLLQQSSSQPPDPLTESVHHGDGQAPILGVDSPGFARTGSVLRRRVSASCSSHSNYANCRNTHDIQLNDGGDDDMAHAADDDVSTAESIMSMPVPLPGVSSTSHHHLRPPTPDHFIAVTPPSPPRSRPHRPSPSMIPAPATDDSIVAHALLSRATSLPHTRSTSHLSTSPTPPTTTPSPPPSLSNNGDNQAHSRVSCWSSGTAPHLSRSGASVPSFELSSKDHMALAGWSWETSTATNEPVVDRPNVAYPPPPSVEEKQVRLPLTLEDLASGRPVGARAGGHERRHESAPVTANASGTAASTRPFSVWGVR